MPMCIYAIPYHSLSVWALSLLEKIPSLLMKSEIYHISMVDETIVLNKGYQQNPTSLSYLVKIKLWMIGNR